MIAIRKAPSVRTMPAVRTASVVLDALSRDAGSVVSLSAPDDPRWAGVRVLAPFEALPQEPAGRTDVYVL